jgi:Mg-chelatase subunit ChlD
MKICENCGASNADAAKFCGECHLALIDLDIITDSEKATENLDQHTFAKTMQTKFKPFQMQRKADILFLLDCTGSMQGEIDAIKNAVMNFADSIQKDGVRARVGLIAFWDRLINQEARVLLFNGQRFTSSPELFRQEVSKLHAKDGGDIPESSLDAVMMGLKQPFAEDAQKVIVLVTDAPPHIPDKDTKSIEEVVDAIQNAKIHQFYLVIHTQEPESQIYLRLLEGTRGAAFELGKGNEFDKRAEHFKRTLMALGKTITQATQ